MSWALQATNVNSYLEIAESIPKFQGEAVSRYLASRLFTGLGQSLEVAILAFWSVGKTTLARGLDFG